MSAMIGRDLLLLILTLWGVTALVGFGAALGWKLGLTIWPHIRLSVGLKVYAHPRSTTLLSAQIWLRTIFIGKFPIFRIEEWPS